MTQQRLALIKITKDVSRAWLGQRTRNATTSENQNETTAFGLRNYGNKSTWLAVQTRTIVYVLIKSSDETLPSV